MGLETSNPMAVLERGARRGVRRAEITSGSTDFPGSLSEKHIISNRKKNFLLKIIFKISLQKST